MSIEQIRLSDLDPFDIDRLLAVVKMRPTPDRLRVNQTWKLSEQTDHDSAAAATLNIVAPMNELRYKSVQNQIRFLYRHLGTRPEFLYRRYIEGNDGPQVASTLNLIAEAAGTALCHPAAPGLFILGREEWSDVSVDVTLNDVCKNPICCPWCHYRMLLRKSYSYAGASCLTDQLSYFYGTHVTIWRSVLEDYTHEQAVKFRRKVSRRIKQTIKPDGFWIVLRPDLGTCVRTGKSSYEFRVMLAGPKDPDLKIPQTLLYRGKVGARLGRLFKELIPFQRGVVRGPSAVGWLPHWYNLHFPEGGDSETHRGIQLLRYSGPKVQDRTRILMAKLPTRQDHSDTSDRTRPDCVGVIM